MSYLPPLEESAALAKIARTLAEIHGQSVEPAHIMKAIIRVPGLRDSPDVAMRIEDMVDNLLTEVWNDWDEKQAMRARPPVTGAIDLLGTVVREEADAYPARPPDRLIPMIYPELGKAHDVEPPDPTTIQLIKPVPPEDQVFRVLEFKADPDD